MEISEAFSPVRAIRHGLAAVQRAPATLLVGGFLIFLVDACSGGSGNVDVTDLVQGKKRPEFSPELLTLFVGMMALGLLIALAAFVTRCWLLPGWIRVQRHVLRSGTDSFPILFGGADAFGRTLGWRLLYNLVLFGTFAAAALPGGALMGFAAYRGMDPTLFGLGAALLVLLVLPSQIYVALGLSLGDYAVALEDLGAVDALDRSWELARGNRLTLLAFFLITGAFGLLGFLACCIGVFATRAVADIGTTEAFLLATQPDVDTWMVPREAGM